MNIELIELLKREVKPAMGCTEPVAVTLAVAKARNIGCHVDVDLVEIAVSANIFKNGLAVGIPKSDEVGILIAGAIGAVDGDSSKGLKIYESIDEKNIFKAKALVNENKVIVKVSDSKEKVYISVKMKSNIGVTEVVISGMHNHFSFISHNNEVLHKGELKNDNQSSFDISKLTIEEIIAEVTSSDFESLEFLLEGFEMNSRIAELGVKNKLGMGVGFTTKQSIDRGLLGDDVANTAMYLTAAASDARMSGVSEPVMSSNGSGNNGITAILPILAYSMKNKVSIEQITKALAISHLLNCYIKNQIGRLSALCSCGIAAATGAGAAITWLMGGNVEQVEGTIQNMIANLSGMICDGAKNSCALKLATAASTGVNAAMFSMAGIVAKSHDGIVACSAEKSVHNLGVLSEKGMKITDSIILGIMRDMQDLTV